MLSHLADRILGAAARAADIVPDADMRLVVPLEGGCAARPAGNRTRRSGQPTGPSGDADVHCIDAARLRLRHRPQAGG